MIESETEVFSRFKRRIDFPQTYSNQCERISMFKQYMDDYDFEDIEVLASMIKELEMKAIASVYAFKKDTATKDKRAELDVINKKLSELDSYHDTDIMRKLLDEKHELVHIVAGQAGLLMAATESDTRKFK